jgi:hypothetical protein
MVGDGVRVGGRRRADRGSAWREMAPVASGSASGSAGVTRPAGGRRRHHGGLLGDGRRDETGQRRQ